MTPRRALLAVALTSLPCLANELGLDRPRAMHSRKVGTSHDTTPAAPIREVCWAYAGSAIVWTADPSLIGVPEVRYQRSCKPGDASRTIAIEGNPIGRAGRYLLVEDEAHGSAQWFCIVDLETGKTVFAKARDTDADLSFVRGDKVGLRFRAELDVACIPDAPACWERMKRDNHVPTSVALAPPDCSAAFTAEPTSRTEPRALAISVPVEVPDLASPHLDFLPGAARCEALP